jgi:hypothetical protein
MPASASQKAGVKHCCLTQVSVKLVRLKCSFGIDLMVHCVLALTAISQITTLSLGQCFVILKYMYCSTLMSSVAAAATVGRCLLIAVSRQELATREFDKQA